MVDINPCSLTVGEKYFASDSFFELQKLVKEGDVNKAVVFIGINGGKNPSDENGNMYAFWYNIKKATEYKDADLLNAIENLAKRYAKQTYHYSDGELVPTSLTHYTSTSTSVTVSPDYAYHYSLS